MPAVTMLNSHTHMMDSKATGRTYRITVSLPFAYDAAAGEDFPFHDAQDKWTTVYVLDGNWMFGMVTDMVRPTSWCGSTTDAIVVGIGYPEADDPKEAVRVQFTRRDHDLTPVPDASVEAQMSAFYKRPVPNGDAENFHKFIRDELIPFIEQTYRADPTKRILTGHSYGGLFALYGLFTTPDLFQTLVVGSPTLSFGDGFTFKQEDAFAKAHKALPARVYLFVGALEDGADDPTVKDTLHMASTLLARNYAGFSLAQHVFPDMNHCEVTGAGLHGGLKWALRKPK